MASLEELNNQAEQEEKEERAKKFLTIERLAQESLPFCVEGVRAISKLSKKTGKPYKAIELDIQAVQGQERYKQTVMMFGNHHLAAMDLPQHWCLAIEVEGKGHRLVNVPAADQQGQCPCERYRSFKMPGATLTLLATEEQKDAIFELASQMMLPLPKDYLEMSQERAAAVLKWYEQMVQEALKKSAR